MEMQGNGNRTKQRQHPHSQHVELLQKSSSFGKNHILGKVDYLFLHLSTTVASNVL